MRKQRAVLVERRALTPSIWHLEFELANPVEGYAPGQFARLHVGGGEWRDYSIAGLSGRRVRFLISTRTGGAGSRFVEAVSVGGTTEVELPLGQYTLSASGRRQVFIATGTGLAPFLPMFERLQATGALDQAVLLFGCKRRDEDITTESPVLPGTVIRCVSREDAPAQGLRGRVTDALRSFEFDPEDTDFYLCGSSAMVADVRALLEARAARHLHAESF